MKRNGWRAVIRRLILLMLAVGVSGVVFFGCSNERTFTERKFLRMDTVISVRLYGGENPEELLDACDACLREMEGLLSATVETSDVSRFNASEDGRDVSMDAGTSSLIERALAIGTACGGAFDITVAPFMDLWKRCETQGRLPTDAEIENARGQVGMNHLTFEDGMLIKDHPGVQIDLGGIGKGAAVDALLALLAESDMTGGLINFGSNVAVFGKKPDGSSFRVALRDPNDAGKTVGTLTLDGRAVLSVSGDYERYYEIDGVRYGHILNPMTGYPPRSDDSDGHLRSVAVLACDGVTADALSTALMVLGETAGRALYAARVYDFEAVFIYDDRVSTTEGITLE